MSFSFHTTGQGSEFSLSLLALPWASGEFVLLNRDHVRSNAELLLESPAVYYWQGEFGMRDRAICP